MKYYEIFALCVLFFLIVMCNTDKKDKSKALFIKICEIDSCYQVDCKVYYFEKTLNVSEEKLIDSALTLQQKTFIGIDAKKMVNLSYIDSDTINFFIYKKDE